MRIGILGLAALAAGWASAAEPILKWDFEAAGGTNLGSWGERYRMTGGEVRAGAGWRGSSALGVSGEAVPDVSGCALDLAAFTVDLRFRLDGDIDPKVGNTLVNYIWKFWEYGRMLVSLTPERRLCVDFTWRVKDGEKLVKKQYQALSDPLKVGSGRMHALRLAVTEAGALTAYLDGVLVLTKDGCPGLRGINNGDPDLTPTLRFGVRTDYRKPVASLDGVLDDIAVYDVALGAPPVEIDPNAGPEEGAPVLVFGANGVCRTPKFLNRGKEGTGENGIGLGNFWRVDAKFRACAATAGVALADDTVTFFCDCPVPDGVEVVRDAKDVRGGDFVEFFFRPDPAGDVHYRYTVNAAGLFAAAKYVRGEKASGWTSAGRGACKPTKGGFKAGVRVPRGELFVAPPKPGDVFTAQFTRIGPTSEGVSYWLPSATTFNDPDTFGRLVYGAEAYCARRIAAAKADAAKLADAAGRRTVEGEIAAAEKLVAAHAGTPGAFGALDTVFENLDMRMMQLKLAGRNLLVYRPTDPWGALVAPTALTRPLERLTIRTTVGARAWCPFAIANLGDAEFVGQVKVFDKGPEKYFCREGSEGAARRFRAYEGVRILSESGHDLWDPLVRLPMNSILRIPPHAHALVWLEFDARGVAPGRHAARLYVKRGSAGFETETVPVEVDVAPADISKVRVGRSGHMYLTTRTDHRAFVKFLVDRNFNTIYCVHPNGSHLGLYPTYGKDGARRPGDMTKLDELIDRHLAEGLDPKEMKLWFYLSFNRGYCPMIEGVGRIGNPGVKWQEPLRDFLAQLYAHLKERYGLGPERIYLHTMDEPGGDVDDPESESGRAYMFGKTIKSFNPAYRLLVDPSMGVKDEEWKKTMTRLAEVYDVVELCRTHLVPWKVDFAKSLGFGEYWTYSVIGKTTSPSRYRGDFWENLRDGFSEYAVYWHLDEHNGGDGIDSTDSKNGKEFFDWGTMLADFDNGYLTPTRRQIASDLGYDDMRLVRWCRDRTKGDAARAARLERIVRDGASAATMGGIERAHDALLDLAGELAK